MARVERIGRALASHPGLHLGRNAMTGVGLEDSIDAAAALADAVLTTSGAIR